jgi:hypothetical protein
MVYLRSKETATGVGIIITPGGELAALAATHVDEVYPAIPKDIPLSKDMPPAFLVFGENNRQNISQGLRSSIEP